MAAEQTATLGMLQCRISLLPISITLLSFLSCSSSSTENRIQLDKSDCWTGAGEWQIPVDTGGFQIRYGHELVVHTAKYLGPRGSVARITNGMNCQNCHLDAGTKPWGNNYGSVASTYPLFRNRSGSIESIDKRITDCFQRSLHARAIDSNSQEVKAIKAYILWLGKEVPKGKKVKGSGIMDLPMMDRAADPEKGKAIYLTQCARCHGKNGAGQKDSIGFEYIYPPLWGPDSYTTGAGMYRLSRLAGFIKNNMPHPIDYHKTLISNSEAWDLAAYINSQPRPGYDISSDWPNKKSKPFDYPFGPYADSFNERQHKFGPWTWVDKKY